MAGIRLSSHAPPLSTMLLLRYARLIDHVPADTPLSQVLHRLYTCVNSWHASQPRHDRRGAPLSSELCERLADFLPPEAMLDRMSDLLEQISPTSHRDLRNAAFHLLWFCREFAKGREPLTCDPC